MSGILVDSTQERGNPDPNRTCDDSLSDVESQVVASLTAEIMTPQCEKADHAYQAPLPAVEQGNAYALPTWLVIPIAFLSLIGVVGGVMELILQYHFIGG